MPVKRDSKGRFKKGTSVPKKKRRSSRRRKRR